MWVSVFSSLPRGIMGWTALCSWLYSLAALPPKTRILIQKYTMYIKKDTFGSDGFSMDVDRTRMETYRIAHFVF